MVHKLGGAITYIYIDSLKETTKSKKRQLDLIKMPSLLNTSHSAPSFWLQCWKVKNRTTMKSWKESESFNHKVAHVFQIIDDLRRIFHFQTVCNISLNIDIKSAGIFMKEQRCLVCHNSLLLTLPAPCSCSTFLSYVSCMFQVQILYSLYFRCVHIL